MGARLVRKAKARRGGTRETETRHERGPGSAEAGVRGKVGKRGAGAKSPSEGSEREQEPGTGTRDRNWGREQGTGIGGGKERQERRAGATRAGSRRQAGARREVSALLERGRRGEGHERDWQQRRAASTRAWKAHGLRMDCLHLSGQITHHSYIRARLPRSGLSCALGGRVMPESTW